MFSQLEAVSTEMVGKQAGQWFSRTRTGHPCNFDKGQIVMNEQLGKGIPKTAGHVGSSQYAVVSTNC